MASNHRNQDNNITAKQQKTNLRNLKSLMKVNMKHEGKNHDIVLNIRIKEPAVADFLRLLLGNPAMVHLFLSDIGVACTYKDTSVSHNESVEDLQLINSMTLTRREIEILNRLSCGMRNKEIAQDKQISIETVKSHLKNVYSKFGVVKRSQAVEKYLSYSAVKSGVPLEA
jgi:DNA-binding CsgD family transcriptional regulator